MSTNLTFKKHPRETGLRAVAYPHRDVDIKHKKKIVGQISAPSPWMGGSRYWTVSVAVCKSPTKESPCKWEWRKLHEATSEDEARHFVKCNSEAITGMNLHYFEEQA